MRRVKCKASVSVQANAKPRLPVFVGGADGTVTVGWLVENETRLIVEDKPGRTTVGFELESVEL